MTPDDGLEALLAEHACVGEDPETGFMVCALCGPIPGEGEDWEEFPTHLAAVVRAAGWMKGREEWGIRYEKTADPTMDNASGEVTSTMWLDSEAKVRAAVKNGAPISARNRRAVRRYVTEPEEA